jgi:ABC-2 type transport system permease protein
MLPPVWQTVTLFNSAVYLISGLRWSFYGLSDVGVGISLRHDFRAPRLCLAVAVWIFQIGYRLKS